MSISFSLEVFPPKSVKAAFTLADAYDTLAAYGPQFTSVTCGTGGGDTDLTGQTLAALQAQSPSDLAAHMACGEQSLSQLTDRAQGYVAQGVRRAVAVRGDTGGAKAVQVCDLIKSLRDVGMDQVYVGAYPETHPKADSPNACLAALKAKQDAGATAAITQFFFEIDTFLRFRDRAVAAGVTLDVIPGILPVVNWTATERMAAMCGTDIAPDLAEGFARAARENRAPLMATAHGAELCDRLARNGVKHLHFYTMNRANPVADILQALGQHATPPLRQVA